MMVSLAWMIYIILLDIFEKENIWAITGTLLLAMIFCIFCLLLYDIWDYRLNFRINGRWLNDLIYCIFGIGFIEEAVKVIPVILILLFTKNINESVDYIIYASISAIGFSFVENISYFTN